MIHNYFFLKRLAGSLHELLRGKELLECYSQNKDELIMGFANGNESTYLRANFVPQIALLHITEDFKRAKKNSIDLFRTLIGTPVESVNVFQYERSFWIDFENGASLLFKMHGSRSNILLATNDQVEELFRTKLSNDLELKPSQLYKRPDLSKERFYELDGDLSQFLPALGKEVKGYLSLKGYSKQEMGARWELLQNTLDLLETHAISIDQDEALPFFTLLPTAKDAEMFQDPIEAGNAYYVRFTKQYYLLQAQLQIVKPLEDQIKKTQNYLKNTENKLLSVLDRRKYDEIANIIMANLHQIQKGQKTITLDDFYLNRPIEIKLNPKLSPQKNAENLYRKAKNQNLEIARLEDNLTSRQKKLEQLQSELEAARQSEDIRLLRKQTSRSFPKETPLPYHVYDIKGYQVMVGKNAKHNDELSLKIANKNDLWLHAKDVAGSHVVIRHQAGKNIPKDVLEITAQLAAWFSKRKTDSLCPVIYTPKKFIRKRKGDPPGAVVVEKEEVIMVEPKNYDNTVKG